MKIYPVTLTDSSIFAEIHTTCLDPAWSLEAFQSILSICPKVIGYKVCIESNPIGFILYRPILDEAEILTLVVLPEFRCLGYGAYLMHHALDDLAKRMVSLVFLEVSALNASAIALYKKFNFIQIGVRPHYYVKKNGKTEDAISMRRFVSTEAIAIS